MTPGGSREEGGIDVQGLGSGRDRAGAVAVATYKGDDDEFVQGVG